MQRPADDGGRFAAAALDHLATSMELGLLLVDADDHPVFANSTALELLGAAGDPAAAWARLKPAMRDGHGAADLRPFTAQLEIDGKARSLRGEVRSRGQVREVLIKDRRQLGALDLELLCASRMKEWTHQCEALVHDANGALNTLQLTLELVDGQWSGAGAQVQEPRRRDHVGVMRDNLNKLKRILRDLAEANDPGPAMASFDVRDVLKEAANTLRMPARRRRVELQVEGPAAELRVQALATRVRQALVNVALARVAVAPERSRVQIGAAATNGGVEFTCFDPEPLSGEERAAIFGILLAERIGGTAADLRLARALVEAEGGEFHADDAQAPGTRIRFTFPAV